MLLIHGKDHDLGGGFSVKRILPFAKKRMVGPFTFLDHMGPFQATAHQNTDVRPHPHIGLSTLTYLFEGRIVHRDSLGYTATIEPGAVNWMTAGRGISHSERTHEEDRAKTHRLHGLQFWIALPDDEEEIQPHFQHYDKAQIPSKKTANFTLNLIAGEAFGLKSPVKTTSPLVFADFIVQKQSEIPLDFGYFEIAVYIVEGSATLGNQKIDKNQMLVLDPYYRGILRAQTHTRFVILGGEPFKTPRIMWWNLVSSSQERINLAKKQWKEGTFPRIPGETEFIPLPEV